MSLFKYYNHLISIMQVKVKFVNAFTERSKGGNPAGVIVDADNLTDSQMMDISSKLGFSESAFVQKSKNADFKVRFFSPTQEVDLCGHATIAIFHTLIELCKIDFGTLDTKIVTQETRSGILPVECNKNGLIVMTQKKPKFYQFENDRELISKLLGIKLTDLMDYPIQSVSTGVSKLIIPVKSLDVLYRIIPDLDGIKEYCNDKGINGFYPFTFETKENSDFHARQFNPLAGIDEDPITGVAAGALGAYIVRHKLSEKKQFVVEQGYILNKPGKMYVWVSDIVKVGGYAFTVAEKFI